jgi:hypothetical protein
MSKKPDGLSAKAPKAGKLPTKAPNRKGLLRSREASPLSTSPKCRKVFWPFSKQGPTAVPR